MRSTIVTVAFELIGVLIVTVFAGFSDDMGKVAVIFMVGVLLGWLMIHANVLGGWVGKGSSGSGSRATFLNV